MPIDVSALVILLLIGAAAGCLSGFIGIGGGLLIVPALMYFLGMSQMMAQGTSLALMLPPI
ncbi:MAG: TSUP family transporter, partial [Flavobacteriales bacterium]|nr:TSUP family transporter [Flavobacteriales bacterium]